MPKASVFDRNTKHAVSKSLLDFAIAFERDPEATLRSVREPAHPLHGQFEWDDAQAAKKYRHWQAGWLARQSGLKL